jgi:uncharacterized protein YutE (UPF0331/DUF86 family)
MGTTCRQLRRHAASRRSRGSITRFAASMRKAVGFRNVLVYEYVAVSDEIVVSRLNDLSDLEAFVKQVNEFVDA